MRNFWKWITHLGVAEASQEDERSIIISNQLAVVMLVIATIMTPIIWSQFGVTATTPVLFLVLVTFASIPLINSTGSINLARVVISISVPIYSMALAIISKFNANTEAFEYFDTRILVLISACVPIIVFPLERRRHIILTLSFTFLVLMLYDPIHNAFGVGYFQKGFKSENYFFINIITFISYLFLVGSVFILKSLLRTKETTR